jgi:hypothetical protein
MQVGIRRGVGAARVDDDQLEVWIGRARCFDAAVDDRVGEGRVGTGDQDQVGEVDVLVAARHGVRAERRLVRGDGGGHA